MGKKLICQAVRPASEVCHFHFGNLFIMKWSVSAVLSLACVAVSGTVVGRSPSLIVARKEQSSTTGKTTASSNSAGQVATTTFTNSNRFLFDTNGNQIDAYGSKVNYCETYQMSSLHTETDHPPQLMDLTTSMVIASPTSEPPMVSRAIVVSISRHGKHSGTSSTRL